MKIILVALTVIFSGVFQNGDGSLSTSISGLENVLNIETNLIQILDIYIQLNENKLTILKRKLEEFKAENERALVDPEEYVTNPFSSFSLIRRLALDWTDLNIYMGVDPGKSVIDQMAAYQNHTNFPKESDVTEAVKGVVRLQGTYKLSPLDAVNGYVNGKKYNHKIHSLDAFTIAKEAYLLGEAYYADTWFKTSVYKFDKEDDEFIYFNFNRDKIYEYAIENKIHQKDLKRALNYTLELLAFSPGNTAGNDYYTTLVDTLNYQIYAGTLPQISFEEPVQPPNQVVYEQGCRGEYTTHPKIAKHLSCVYVTDTHPFLKLAPIKMEIIHLDDPYVVVYHNITYEKEVKILQELAKPQLNRAYVWDPEEKKAVSSESRTSKFAWFTEESHELIPTLTQRIEDMTGLTMETSEHVQVMNYGIGGHYSGHNDYFELPLNQDAYKFITYNKGNRIATLLFYLTDVDQGGFTVFPKIGAAVKPVKGTAVFWYNLKPDGEGNPKTLHAACPVLVGSKWVFNKWIRSNGQMFRRPCPKDYLVSEE